MWYIDCAPAFQAVETGLSPVFRSSLNASMAELAIAPACKVGEWGFESLSTLQVNVAG